MYYKFEVYVDNGFKGRTFIAHSSEVEECIVRTGILRQKKYKYYGMKATKLYAKDVEGEEVGIPDDIKHKLLTDKESFIRKATPIIGRVLVGKYKDVEFILRGRDDVDVYFKYPAVRIVIKGRAPHHNGCTFRWGSYDDTLKVTTRFNQDMQDNIKKHIHSNGKIR